MFQTSAVVQLYNIRFNPSPVVQPDSPNTSENAVLPILSCDQVSCDASLTYCGFCCRERSSLTTNWIRTAKQFSPLKHFERIQLLQLIARTMDIVLLTFKKQLTPIARLVAVVILTGCSTGCNSSHSETGVLVAILFAMFVTPLLAGAVPLLGIRTHKDFLRWATSVAAGFLIASALLVAVPEGFELVSGEKNARDTVHSHEKDVSQRRSEADVVHVLEDKAESGDKRVGIRFHLAPGLALLAGFMLMLIVESLGFGHDLHEEHHHEGAQGDHLHHPSAGTPEGRGLGSAIIIGLTIHAVTDGLAMGAALATGSVALTTPLMLGIIMHKMPAALSLSVFSQHSHGDMRRTWRELVFFSVATPLALLISWCMLGSLEEYWLGMAVLAAAGTFLYVATVDVLPNVIHGGNRKLVLIQVCIGTVVISSLLLLLESLGFSTHH